MIEYEEYTEDELRPYFDKEFEERILPPVYQGKKYILMIRAVMKLQVSFKIISIAIMNNLILYWCGYIMRYKGRLI